MRISRWLPVVMLLALAAPAMRAETAAKMPAPTGYVDDYAGVFSDSARSDMESLCREVHDKTKAQIFVVTIHSLDGATIEQFANDLFHTWKIGEKKTDRGVLLLFAIQDHKYRYEVGYGLEGILNDAKVGDMGRAMVPDLRAANYDAAATLGLQSVAQVIADDSKVELDGLQAPDASSTDENQQAPPPLEPVSSESSTGRFILWLLPLVFLLSIFGFVALVIIRSRRGTGNSGGGWSSGGDSSNSSDSSSSDSSSSDSFSGGDGGDSGGGGASGSW